MSDTGRRVVRRWTWRMFRREWHQQVLVLALVALALAATAVMAAAASNAPPPATAQAGTAAFIANVPGGPELEQRVRAFAADTGPVELIDHRQVGVPGTALSVDLRGQSPRGRYSRPLLNLLTGRYPTAGHEIAVSPVAAADLGLSLGATWRPAGLGTWRVVGTVENPDSLLDAFVLVAPGRVPAPTSVTVLFDASPRRLPAALRSLTYAANRGGGFSAALLVDLVAAFGLTLIGLVSVAAFTIIARRRQRSLGLLGSVGATDARLRQAVLTNGWLTGLSAVLLGAPVGLGLWALYRPHLQSSAHHVIGLWHLPWGELAVAAALALLTPLLASIRPAREMARQPIVRALESRPPTPRPVARSATPGVVMLVVGFLVLGYAAGRGGASLVLVLAGFVTLVVGLVLLTPIVIAALGAIVPLVPLSARLAIRDLTRYRARSAATLAALSIAVMAAMSVLVATSARYSDPLDYVGPNLSSTQLLIQPAPQSDTALTSTQSSVAHELARSLGSTALDLVSPAAGLVHQGPGRNWSGQLFVATPALLAAFRIPTSAIQPRALVVTHRPGLSGVADLVLVRGGASNGQATPGLPSADKTGPSPTSTCTVAGGCVANPAIQELAALPGGTSAPNTVVTEFAVRTLHLATYASGWLLTAPQPLDASQIAQARSTAASAGLVVETRSGMPTSGEVAGWATGAAFALALGLVAMALGLFRGETVEDRRILVVTGASSWTRRGVGGVVAMLLALLGAVLGSLGAYVAVAAVLRAQPQSASLLSELTQVPTLSLLAIFVGLPVVAGGLGWLLSGGAPARLTRPAT